MKSDSLPYEGRRMDAAAHGYVHYKWSVCSKCGCEIRYTCTGNCVDCTNRRSQERHAAIAKVLREAKVARVG